MFLEESSNIKVSTTSQKYSLYCINVSLSKLEDAYQTNYRPQKAIFSFIVIRASKIHLVRWRWSRGKGRQGAFLWLCSQV